MIVYFLPHTQIFNTSGTGEDVTNTTLDELLIVQRLRVLPYTWDSNPPCLRLEVYGCVAHTGMLLHYCKLNEAQ